MFRAPGLTAVAVASANNYTAVFLGTTTGRLLKVSMQVVSASGRATEGQSHSAFFSFPSRLPQQPVTEGGTGLSSACIRFQQLLAWGLLPVLQLLDLCNAHGLSGPLFPYWMQRLGDFIEGGNSTAGHHLRGPVSGLTMRPTTLQVPELRKGKELLLLPQSRLDTLAHCLSTPLGKVSLPARSSLIDSESII